MSWWNDLWTGVGDFFTGGAITRNKELKKQNEILAQNYANQQSTQDYEKALQERIFQREDTAVQRRVNDLIKAGLNPNLASNQGAAAGQAISLTTPQQQYSPLDSVGAGVGNFLSNAVGVSQTMASAIASAQQIGIVGDNRKWYKDNNLPYGYSGLATDMAAITGSGTSLIEAFLGAEAATAFTSAWDQFASLAGEGAEAASNIADFAKTMLDRFNSAFEDYESGGISIFDALSAVFSPSGVDVAKVRKDGRYLGLDGYGNEVYRLPSGSRAHIKSASSKATGNPYL